MKDFHKFYGEVNESVSSSNLAKLAKAAKVEADKLIKSAKSQGQLAKDDAYAIDYFASIVADGNLGAIKKAMSRGDTEVRETMFMLAKSVLGVKAAEALSGSKAIGKSVSEANLQTKPNQRSYKIFGYTPGKGETYVTTIFSLDQLNAIRAKMKRSGEFDYIHGRDALGNLRVEINFATGRQTVHTAKSKSGKVVFDKSEKSVSEDNTNDKSDDGEGMDKVQPKAVKKKFANRKDKDLDNDGDEDESDEYLHTRRKAISKNMGESMDAASSFTTKEIKMAIGVAQDRRYAGGNYTGAVNTIEKIKKGLSKHPRVAEVLKKANESMDESTATLSNKERALYQRIKTAAKSNPKKALDMVQQHKDDFPPSVWDELDAEIIRHMKHESVMDEGAESIDELTTKPLAHYKKQLNSIATFAAKKAKELQKNDDDASKWMAKVADKFARAAKLDDRLAMRNSLLSGDPKDRKMAYNIALDAFSGRHMDVKKFINDLDTKKRPNPVDESKSSTGYELYHRDFSSAMQHAYKHAKNKFGIDVDPEEIDSKVASGPRKPSKGKTNSYRLLDKGGKKAIQVQVYGMDNGKYELNMYKESVDTVEEATATKPADIWSKQMNSGAGDVPKGDREAFVNMHNLEVGLDAEEEFRKNQEEVNKSLKRTPQRLGDNTNGDKSFVHPIKSEIIDGITKALQQMKTAK